MAAVPGDLVFTSLRRSTRAEITWRSRMPDTGVIYAFRAVWNSRAQVWHLDIRRSDGTPLLLGMAMRCRTDMLAPFEGADWPLGQLWVEDTEGHDRDPDRTGWRTYSRLIYRRRETMERVAGTPDEVL